MDIRARKILPFGSRLTPVDRYVDDDDDDDDGMYVDMRGGMGGQVLGENSLICKLATVCYYNDGPLVE